MLKFLKLILLGSMIVLAACQTIQEKLMAENAIKMTDKEVIEFLSDKTFQSVYGKGAEYYAPDGIYIYADQSKEVYGEWTVTADGTTCLKIESWWGEQPKCNWDGYKIKHKIFVYDFEKDVLHEIHSENISDGNML